MESIKHGSTKCESITAKVVSEVCTFVYTFFFIFLCSFAVYFRVLYFHTYSFTHAFAHILSPYSFVHILCAYAFVHILLRICFRAYSFAHILSHIFFYTFFSYSLFLHLILSCLFSHFYLSTFGIFLNLFMHRCVDTQATIKSRVLIMHMQLWDNEQSVHVPIIACTHTHATRARTRTHATTDNAASLCSPKPAGSRFAYLYFMFLLLFDTLGRLLWGKGFQ